MDDNDELDIREFDVNPETGNPAVVHRSFQDLERKEIEDDLAEAEIAQLDLAKREDAATKARKEGDRRVAALKSELDGFDEVAQRAGAYTRPAGDGSPDSTRDEESDEAVDL